MYQRSIFFTTILVVLTMIITSWAQNPIVNPGFEDWTEGQPDGWVTNNVPGFYTFVTQSDISHSGSSAAQGSVVTYLDEPIPPLLATGFDYFPIAQNYASFTGYYQFSTSASDSFYVSVLLFDAQYGAVAYGYKVLSTTMGGYTKFTVDLEYYPTTTEPAAYAFIEFFISSETESVDPSSTFLLDDVEFSGITAVESPLTTNVPDKFSLDQNYPNPFNPITNIKFQLPEAEFVTITIFNTLGQKVETLLDKQMPAGIHQVQFNALNIAGGVYFYEIKAGNFVQMKKMVLVK